MALSSWSALDISCLNASTMRLDCKDALGQARLVCPVGDEGVGPCLALVSETEPNLRRCELLRVEHQLNASVARVQPASSYRVDSGALGRHAFEALSGKMARLTTLDVLASVEIRPRPALATRLRWSPKPKNALLQLLPDLTELDLSWSESVGA